MIFLHTGGDISTSVTHSHEILLWEKFQDKEHEVFCVAWGLVIFLAEPHLYETTYADPYAGAL